MGVPVATQGASWGPDRAQRSCVSKLRPLRASVCGVGYPGGGGVFVHVMDNCEPCLKVIHNLSQVIYNLETVVPKL